MSENNNYRVDKKGYNIEYCEDGVFLTVLPLAESGILVEVDEVLAYLEQKHINDYEEETISLAIRNADGARYKIAEEQEEYKIDAVVQLKISADKMTVSMEIFPPDGGKVLSNEDIIKALHNEGIVFGLDYEMIDTISKFPVYHSPIIIARGTPPIPGENGKMQYHFELSKNRTPKLLEDGRVDFHELNLIENVRVGDVLITAIPPTKGELGKNVLGEEIPPTPGKSVVLPQGQNVKISEDGQKLLASIDGQVVIANQKVNVYALYEVPGNVDTSVGNISFIGNVIIKGNVLTGFTIEAGGTVEVQGVVEGATIKAEGDIVLRRGMQGLNRGVLITNGNIVAKYIENSHLIAKGDIKSEAIMHSTVECGGKLELGGKKGLIVGGIAKVWREIKAKMIGSPMATITELEVGVDPKIRDRYKELRTEIVRVESEITKTNQAIQLLRKLESANKLDDYKRQLMDKSVKTKVFLDNKLQEIKQEFIEIEKRLEEEGNGKIKVSGMVYPGTKVTIGSCMMYVREKIKYSTLYCNGVDVKVGEYTE